MIDGSRVVVLGATGATGRHLVPALLERGASVRVVARSRDRLVRRFDRYGVELHPADLTDAAAARQAVRGCDLAFHCVGLPAGSFDLHVPIARNTVGALRREGARGLLVSSYWSYGPGDPEPMSEGRAYEPGSRLADVRRRQEQVFLEEGGTVAVLPDFFGPPGEVSLLNDALEAVGAGHRALWPGDPDVPREFLFLPDVGRLLCELAARPEARGRRYNVPGSGARPPRALLARAARIADTRLKLFRGRRWQARLLGLFQADARAFADVYPLYDRPALLDTRRYEELAGRVRTTPFEETVPATLAWLSGRDDGSD